MVSLQEEGRLRGAIKTHPTISLYYLFDFHMFQGVCKFSQQVELLGFGSDRVLWIFNVHKWSESRFQRNPHSKFVFFFSQSLYNFVNNLTPPAPYKKIKQQKKKEENTQSAVFRKYPHLLEVMLKNQV